MLKVLQKFFKEKKETFNFDSNHSLPEIPWELAHRAEKAGIMTANCILERRVPREQLPVCMASMMISVGWQLQICALEDPRWLGRIDTEDGMISVSSYLREEDQRWIAAKALCHAIAHTCGDLRLVEEVSAWMTLKVVGRYCDRYEAEAQSCAALLLVPPNLWKDYAYSLKRLSIHAKIGRDVIEYRKDLYHRHGI